MAFFHYRQNNSGGGFDFDVDLGITHHVVIEAENSAAANQRAEAIGLYWDGVENGRDCECCGDRWYPAYDDKGSEAPEVYGQPASNYESTLPWMEPSQEIAVHFADERIEWFGVVTPKSATA